MTQLMLADESHSLMMDSDKAESGQTMLKLYTLSDCLLTVYNQITTGRLILLEPRKFVPPGGYHSPRCIAAGLECILAIGELKTVDELFPTEITAQAIVYKIINHRVPVYFLADDFIRAVAATELPHDFTLADLHWPMPAMVMGLPIRFTSDYLGRDTCYVFAADFDAGDHYCRFLPLAPAITMPKAKIALGWFACVNGRLESFVSSYWKEDRVDEIIQKYSYTDYTGGEALKVRADKECCDQLSALIFKLLVVLNTRPSLVETGKCIRLARMHKSKQRGELWSPNIIGAKYRMLRERQIPTGTHASPRMHWRRGHLRNHAHGLGRALRKLIWIEPTLIGI